MTIDELRHLITAGGLTWDAAREWNLWARDDVPEGDPMEEQIDTLARDERYTLWVTCMIGPRQVGGRYRSRHSSDTYEVVEIDAGPRDDWPIWQITARRMDDGEIVSHCTPWDDRDIVVHAPPTTARR